MKKYNIIFSIIAAAGIALTVSSCKKGFLEGYDVDPNNATAVSPDLQLSTAQVATAAVYGGDYARYTDMWTQHQAGTDRQFAAIGQYVVTESDVDNVWRFNAYAGGMEDLYILMTDQTEEGNMAYAGVAKILMASNIGLVTDCFGDVPYSQAFQGAEETTPAYDSQEQIYTTIMDLLETGSADLDGESPLSPGADDLIYGGDLALWHGAANALKARYLLHLANRTDDYAAVLGAIDAGAIADNAGDMQVPFGQLVTEQNFWFQFYDQRPGYLSMGAYFIDQLNALEDPRLPQYATTNVDGDYVGAEPGEATSDAFSILGPFYGSDNSPIPVITYVEQKFIEAEAAFNTGDATRAAEAYNAGITASMEKTGVIDAAADYLAANASETSGSITLEKIMNQKYLALFTQVESWTDYRRTGFPAITPASGQVPLRLPYPSSERLYNGSNVPAGTSTSSPVWWDVD